MAVTAAPRPRRSLLGTALSAAAARVRMPGKQSRLAHAAAVARQHVVTAAALASLDVGLFHWGPGVGWIGVCFSLLALDFAVTG